MTLTNLPRCLLHPHEHKGIYGVLLRNQEKLILASQPVRNCNVPAHRPAAIRREHRLSASSQRGKDQDTTLRTAYIHGTVYAKQATAITRLSRGRCTTRSEKGEQLKREQVFCVCFICELRNCRLSLSSSHMGIKDDSGFRCISAVRRRFFLPISSQRTSHQCHRARRSEVRDA